MPDRVASLAARRWTAAVDEARARQEAERAAAADEEHKARADESLRERHARWWADPVAFVTEAFDWPEGQALTRYQRRALRRLAQGRRLALRSLHGAGKTGVAAFAVLWFVVTREFAGADWKAITTASVWRQLEEYLWPEIHKWVRRMRWDVCGMDPWRKGRELLDLSITLTYGSAFAVASDDPAKIEGAHADQLLYVFDEAKSIRSTTFDAAEGAFSGAGADTAADAYALALSTPDEPAGRFYDICRRAPGTEDWEAMHVTLADAIAEGRVSAEWAEARRRQWGEDSAVYRNRVLGEFATDGADNVIPLSWVEAANERWHAMVAAGQPRTVTEVGIDVARYGVDDTVMASVAGDFVGSPYRPGVGDTQFLASRALPLIGRSVNGPVVVVDADNIGAGLYDELANLFDIGSGGYFLRPRVHAFRGGMRSDWTDRSGQLRFANLRAAAWWHLRDMLDPATAPTLALPPDDRLTGDLTAPHWRETAGRILVESKGDLRGRIGRSTDTGDAVVYACWGKLLAVRAATKPATHKGPGGITDDLLRLAM